MQKDAKNTSNTPKETRLNLTEFWVVSGGVHELLSRLLHTLKRQTGYKACRARMFPTRSRKRPGLEDTIANHIETTLQDNHKDPHNSD